MADLAADAVDAAGGEDRPPIMVEVRALSPIHADRRYDIGETLVVTPAEAAVLVGLGVAVAA